jgi:hypothetical protein
VRRGRLEGGDWLGLAAAAPMICLQTDLATGLGVIFKQKIRHWPNEYGHKQLLIW